MKVFVAGGTGAIGRPLLLALGERGYDVVGISRRAEGVATLRRLGAEGHQADLLDRDAVTRLIRTVRPDVVVHQATDLARLRSLRRFDDEFAGTNRLRTAGIDNLLAAARDAGVRHVVAQSYGSWIYRPGPGALRTEDDPLDPAPPAAQSRTLAAIRYLEESLAQADGIDAVALRFGTFYGAGSGLGHGGDMLEMVRARKLPVIGSGGGVWSFIHVDDAAAATVAAIERGATGVYNVSDDDPASVRTWLPALAAAIGAKPPHRLPVWLGRLAIGEAGVALMTRVPGMSNERARRDLGWQPEFPSWRDGFRRGLGA